MTVIYQTLTQLGFIPLRTNYLSISTPNFQNIPLSKQHR